MARSYPVKNAIISLLTNKYLSSIETNRGKLYPDFDKDITNYTIDFGNEITSIEFKATPSELGADIKLNGIKLPINTRSSDIYLEEGINNHVIRVTAEDGTTKDYNISVNRFPSFNNLIPNLDLAVTNDLTLSAWVYLPATGVDRYAITKYNVFQLEAVRSWTTVPRVTLYFDDTTNLTLSATGFNITTNTWIHLAATHDSATGISKIFVNGALINSATNEDKIGVNLAQNTEPILCGTKKWESINCSVRDCRVYNGTLSDIEIMSIYHLSLLDATITSINPLSGIAGDRVNVYGTNLSPSSVVSIKGIQATTTYVNPYQLYAIVPVLDAGAGVLSVTTDSVVLTSAINFTVVVPPLIPTITRITPAGFAGETVTIQGTNFSNIPGRNKVFFNGGNLSATILTENNTAITCTVPVGVDIGFIQLINDYNMSCYSPYEFLALQSNAGIVSTINAAHDGDTIALPSGAYLFTAQLTTNKSLNLIGNNTYFVSRFTTYTQNVIRMNSNIAKPFRISGITFQCGQNTPQGSYLYFTNPNPQFRIDHCSFYNCGQNSIIIKNRAFGVIDHCYFYNPGGNAIQLLYEQDNDLGDYPFNNPEPLGTEKAVFIEDSTFIGVPWSFTCPIDGFCGVRYVFRHNIVNIKSNYPLITAHGSWGYGRGNYSVEIYENSFTGATSYWGIFIRGGRGVIYNNSILGKVDIPIAMGEYRVFNSKTQWATSYPTTPPHLNWADDQDEVDYLAAHPEIIGTSLDYCDNVYPAPDQVNNFYVWSNTYNGNPVGVFVRDIGRQLDFIQLNRDYFTTEMPGYLPYTYPHPLQNL